jgi:transposase
MGPTENRARANRDKLRAPSEVTEEEWAEMAPLLAPARRGGRQRTVTIRAVCNGLLSVVSPGCPWRAIPRELPPRRTISPYLGLGEAEGTLRRIEAAR